MQSILEAMLEDFKLTVGGETDQTSGKYSLGKLGTNKSSVGNVASSWGRKRRGLSVWIVLEVRCKDLIQADQAERDLSVHVPRQSSVPQSVQKLPKFSNR